MERARKKSDPFESVPASSRALLPPGWLFDDGREVLAAARVESQRPRPAHRSAWRNFVDRCGDVMRTAPGPRHPLAGSAWLCGATHTEQRQLARRFRAAIPRHLWNSRSAALWHLQQIFPRSPWSTWDEVRGIHVVLGAAGSGKSTLVLKLALAARRAGQDAEVLSFAPTRPEAARFVAAAEALGLPYTILRAADAAAVNRRGRRVLFVDTPCFSSRPEVATQLLPVLRSPASVLHFVLCPHHGAEFIARQLDQVAKHGVDYIAATQLDLAPGIGALLGPQMQHKRRFSFLNAGADFDTPLAGFSTQALLRACGALTSGTSLP